MPVSPSPSHATDTATTSLDQVISGFKQAVIDRFQIVVGNQLCSYREYVAISETSEIRSGDEANAVDQQFTRYILEWLGFTPSDWTYNQPQAGTGKKLNRPDYLIRGSVGTAFIVEDKNSSLDFNGEEHLKQMRRYCLGTAGYAIWCNMRRLLAVRFMPENTLTHETLVDVSIEKLFGPQQVLTDEDTIQATNLALFQLLFSKDRFTNFKTLAEKIGVDEQTFENRAIPIDTPQAIDNFISGSRQTLNHLKLAALSQILEARSRNKNITDRENLLHHEWMEAARDFTQRINYDIISKPVFEAIAQLTPRVGILTSAEIYSINKVVREASKKTMGSSRFSATLRPLFEIWLDRALHINSALLRQQFDAVIFE